MRLLVVGLLLHSCDGSRSLLEVARSFSTEETIDGIQAVKVGLYGLDSLLRRGLVEIKEDELTAIGLCDSAAKGAAAVWNRNPLHGGE